MTFDPSTRRLVGLMDDLATGDDGYVEDVLTRTSAMKQRPAWRAGPGWAPMTSRRLTLVVGLAAVLALVAASAAYVASRPKPAIQTTTVSNGWVAFSSMPGIRQVGSTDFRSGSDLYLVRPGGEPIVVADRLDGLARNVCPTFSPDGHTLAFGSSRSGERSIVLIGVSRDVGPLEDTRAAIAVPGKSATAPCPRWSADGRRIAYLDGGAVVVRDLVGSTLEATTSDPTIDDFADDFRSDDPLISPAGDRIARTQDGCEAIVAGPSGTDSRVVVSECGYAAAAWSPDRRWFLVMEDVSGDDFTMSAVSVVDPTVRKVIAAMIPVNGARSWPGRGDVAWQPVFD